MGEIADDIIDGACCALCGCYFVSEEGSTLISHGYPVACEDCWEPGCGYPKAEYKTL